MEEIRITNATINLAQFESCFRSSAASRRLALQSYSSICPNGTFWTRNYCNSLFRKLVLPSFTNFDKKTANSPARSFCFCCAAQSVSGVSCSSAARSFFLMCLLHKACCVCRLQYCMFISRVSAKVCRLLFKVPHYL